MKYAAAALTVLGLISSPPMAHAQSKAQLEANKKVVMDFEREVLQAQNVDNAKKYYTPDMIQHNPMAPQGLQGFVQAFGPRWTPKPVKPVMDPAPAEIIAEGDLVMVMMKQPRPDPANPGQTYDAFWFDMFRVKNGMIVEHWDPATKPPMAANGGAPRPG